MITNSQIRNSRIVTQRNKFCSSCDSESLHEVVINVQSHLQSEKCLSCRNSSRLM